MVTWLVTHKVVAGPVLAVRAQWTEGGVRVVAAVPLTTLAQQPALDIMGAWRDIHQAVRAAFGPDSRALPVPIVDL
jgi:hypothetical protein